MAAELDESLFKTTLMGGFDKEDVMAKFREARDEADAERKSLEEQIAERDSLIEELRQSVKAKETEIEQLQKDIREKYQSYIDNYDSIGKLVFDAKVRSDNMMAETKEKCEKMLQETKEDCARLVKEAREKEEEVVAVYEAKIEQQAKEAQQFMQQQMAQGSSGYRMVQTEVTQIIRAMDALQKGFLESYKKVRMVKDAWTDPLTGWSLFSESCRQTRRKRPESRKISRTERNSRRSVIRRRSRRGKRPALRRRKRRRQNFWTKIWSLMRNLKMRFTAF